MGDRLSGDGALCCFREMMGDCRTIRGKEVDVANEEHLAKLKEGIEKWNQWREANEYIRPDLSDADLRGENLKGANLSNANLIRANFIRANLSSDVRRGIKGANLNQANLSEANLGGASLFRTDFIRANLSRAYLSEAMLGEADFREANLNRADLREVDLRMANLSGANLSEADLFGAVLVRANLSKANFNKANLTNANLTMSNFSEVDLCDANLGRVQALETNFTSAKLTGAYLEDWNINRKTQLVNVNCEYIYLQCYRVPGEREYIFSDRRPSDPNTIFAPGEFTKLFQKALETVDLIFTDGIDWKAFFQSFQELQTQYDDENIAIQAIEKKSGGAFVIRLEVSPEADKGAIESRAKELYKRDRQLLEAQYQALLQAKDGQITVYQEWLKAERKDNTDLTGIVKTMAEKDMSRVTQQFNGPVTGVAGNVEGNQNIYSLEQRQTLSEAAKEIQQLLNQLSETYPTTTSTGQMAIATKAVEEIEKNPTLKRRVIGALKAGGTEALKELVDHPAVNILLAVLEGWQKPE